MPPSLPPLRLLTVFETVLRRGSAREAAAELNVSQPAVSQSLRQLENHVGTPLLDRSTRPAALTAAGRMLETASLDGLGRIADAVAQIRRMRAADESAVTIACSVGFATYWLMPRLRGLLWPSPGHRRQCSNHAARRTATFPRHKHRSQVWRWKVGRRQSRQAV